MEHPLSSCPLFAGLAPGEIQACLDACGAAVRSYAREQIIFRPGETPARLLVLLEGAVRVGRYLPDGERRVVASFDRPGELFGEVFLFLPNTPYEHFAEAAAPCRVLALPRDFFACAPAARERLVENLLSIFAQKAYFLNQRVQILSCATLRQKLARVLLRHAAPDGRVRLPMGREELADFLGAARPSVSRELARMRDDGLIAFSRAEIRLLEPAALERLV